MPAARRDGYTDCGCDRAEARGEGYVTTPAAGEGSRIVMDRLAELPSNDTGDGTREYPHNDVVALPCIEACNIGGAVMLLLHNGKQSEASAVRRDDSADDPVASGVESQAHAVARGLRHQAARDEKQAQGRRR